MRSTFLLYSYPTLAALDAALYSHHPRSKLTCSTNSSHHRLLIASITDFKDAVTVFGFLALVGFRSSNFSFDPVKPAILGTFRAHMK